jgi:hypothetical protein
MSSPVVLVGCDALHYQGEGRERDRERERGRERGSEERRLAQGGAPVKIEVK